MIDKNLIMIGWSICAIIIIFIVILINEKMIKSKSQEKK